MIISPLYNLSNADKLLVQVLEYHRMVGIEHFYMYDWNVFGDGTYEPMKTYLAEGTVTLIPWELERAGEWIARASADPIMYSSDVYISICAATRHLGPTWPRGQALPLPRSRSSTLPAQVRQSK